MTEPNSQIDLSEIGLSKAKEKTADLPEAFKRLYYHLYSNSKASRAGRILEDVAFLLMLKLSTESNGNEQVIQTFLDGDIDAEEGLVPVLSERYPNLITETYRFNLDKEHLRFCLEIFTRFDLTHAPAHILGEAFQALIGPRFRGDKGQFFTPRSLVRAMVKIIDPSPDESVLDPACGTGGFLIEAHTHQVGDDSSSCSAPLVGIDKDVDLYRIAAVLLRIAAGERAQVHNWNSLRKENWDEHTDGAKFDVILTNPPFGGRIGIKDDNVLSDFAFGHKWVKHSESWRMTETLERSEDPQILFLEQCIRRLRPGGRLGIVLPEGVFGNRKTGYTWDFLRERGEVMALLDCPRTTFQPSTDTKTNVLFYRKAVEEGAGNGQGGSFSTRVAVAMECGHDKRGRTELPDGSAYPNDLPAIAKEYSSGGGESTYWKDVEVDNPYYLVPRFYYPEEARDRWEKELVEGATTASIRDLVRNSVLEVRKGHEVGSAAYGTGEVPFVRTSDISNFEISVDPTKSVSEEVYRQYADKQNLRGNDILMVVDGRYRIGKSALLTERNRQSVIQSHLLIISVKRPEVVSPFELLFALNLPSVKRRLRNLAFIQSTLATVGKRINNLEVPILHAEGPWSKKVERFEDALRERDRLLADLQGMAGPEYRL